jgi:hypothetical protein
MAFNPMHSIRSSIWLISAIILAAGTAVGFGQTPSSTKFDMLASSQIVLNMVTKPAFRHRILTIWRLFRKYEKHLGAISIIGTVQEG